MRTLKEIAVLVGILLCVIVAGLIVAQIIKQAHEDCPYGVWVRAPAGYECVTRSNP